MPAVSQLQNIAANGAGGAGGGLLAGLRLFWSAPEQRDKIIVAVEGKDDLHFYGRFFNPARITLQQSKGCGRIARELRNLNPMQIPLIREFLVVILDADGIRLPGVTPKVMPEMVFYADTRDWETTVMRDMPLRDFWTTTLSQDAANLDVDQHLLQPLYHWSCIAGHCFIRQYQHGLNASVNMAKGFDWPVHTGLSLPDTLDAVKQLKANVAANGATKPEVEAALDENDIQALATACHTLSPWDLHRGHNLVKGLCHLYKTVTHRQINEQDMTERLADAFPASRFRATALATSLAAYLLTRGIPNPWKP